ncbi:MAG: fumarylacetoacetate hydrolase family protein [Gammaproteobacteria bacterium]
MAVNVLHFELHGERRWGVVCGDRVIPLDGRFETTAEFLHHHTADRLRSVAGEGPGLDGVTILSPVTRNQQFICQGANYRQHMIESGLDPDAKTFNMIFRKASSSIVGANEPLVRPPHVRLLDYEIELGLVLGRDVESAVAVDDGNLHEYVAGLVMVNDYSARDVQIPQMQFYKGKSYRSFGPVGPYLCLLEREDFARLRDLRLELAVNGRVRQQDSTANLVFGPAETLTELSATQDLHRGDLIATGTPSGCALRIPSPLLVKLLGLLPERLKWRAFVRAQSRRDAYLADGDVVESRIASGDGRIDLGVQRNEVVRETATAGRQETRGVAEAA